MAKNIQWKKSTIDYDKLNELTPRALAAAQNLKNIPYETRLKQGKIIAALRKERGTDIIGVKKAALTKAKNCTSGITDAKKGAETKRKRGTDEVGWNKIRKINEELADEIRSKYIPRKYTMHMLAAEYGVGYQTIRRVVTKTITLKK
tara:strand:+ start:1069 stop:1509 length:441 start_codon:yes stop_codon:yes gene_type:complete